MNPGQGFWASGIALAVFGLLLALAGGIAWRSVLERRDAERTTRLVAHDAEVLEAAKELHRGQLSLPGFEMGGGAFRFYRGARFLRGAAAVADTLDRAEESVKIAEEGLELLPDWPHLHLVRGLVLESLGRPVDTVESVSIALELSAELPEPHELLARILESGTGVESLPQPALARLAVLARALEAKAPETASSALVSRTLTRRRAVTDSTAGSGDVSR